jgi:hypothetical protein
VLILRVLVVSYLVATLSATGMAKLINHRTASVGMAREGVLPLRVMLPVILAATATELSLAVFLVLGIYPEIMAFGTAALFILFAGYRIIVAIKVKAVVCSCAGTIRTDLATPAVVAGGVLACTCQAVLACVVPFLGHPSGYPLNLLSVISLILPIAVAVIGLRARKRISSRNQIPARSTQKASVLTQGHGKVAPSVSMIRARPRLIKDVSDAIDHLENEATIGSCNRNL